MALASVGVDMVEIARMEKVLRRRPNFAKRVFTKTERAYCDRMARPAQHYAARFAAREAVLKALGTGFSRGVGFADVSVGRNEAGQPQVILQGVAERIAAEQGVREVALSLSYTHDVAVASAVAVTDEVRPQPDEKPDPKEELRASFRAARSVIDELERVEERRDEPAGPAVRRDEPEAASAAAPEPAESAVRRDEPEAASAAAPEPASAQNPEPEPKAEEQPEKQQPEAVPAVTYGPSPEGEEA